MAHHRYGRALDGVAVEIHDLAEQVAAYEAEQAAWALRADDGDPGPMPADPVAWLDETLPGSLYPAGDEVEVGWLHDGETWSAPPPPEEVELDPETLRTIATNERYTLESAGVLVSGARFATDERGRAAILEAVMAASFDPGWSAAWKTLDGDFVTLDGAGARGVLAAASTYRRNLFAAEEQVLAAIAAGALTTAADIRAAFEPAP